MAAAECPCRYTAWMSVSCLIGLLLSGYAVYVESQIHNDHDYTAMCDISERISCTKVFSTRFGRGFGILGLIFGEDSPLNPPNGIIGVFAYIITALLGVFQNLRAAKIQVVLCAASNVLSIYLASILYILDDFCVVCVSTYAVNFANLIISWKHYRLLKDLSLDTKKLD